MSKFFLFVSMVFVTIGLEAYGTINITPYLLPTIIVIPSAVFALLFGCIAYTLKGI